MVKPVRSAALVILAVIMTLTMTISSVFAYTPEGSRQLRLKECKGASVLETGTNVFLYGKNADKRFYPASTTKVLTAIVVLEHVKDLNKKTKVSYNAVEGIDPSSSHIALDIGEKIRLRDLMYGLLLCSGNDCAVALAEDVAGSVKKFAKMMNKKAREIGAKNSHFTNPHGLFNKRHYTTPNDLAKIMAYCVKNKRFVKIFRTIKYIIPKTNKSKKRELWNNHRLIKYKYRYYKGVVGGKTGYIDESGFNLITFAHRGKMNLITVCMRATGQKEIDLTTRALFNRYFKKFHIATVKKDDIKDTVKLEDKKVTAHPEKDIKVIIPKKAGADDVKVVTKFSKIKLPVKKGDRVGTVRCSYKGRLAGKGILVSDDDYATKAQTITEYTGIAVGAALIVIIIIVVAVRSRKKKPE